MTRDRTPESSLVCDITLSAVSRVEIGATPVRTGASGAYGAHSAGTRGLRPVPAGAVGGQLLTAAPESGTSLSWRPTWINGTQPYVRLERRLQCSP